MLDSNMWLSVSAATGLPELHHWSFSTILLAAVVAQDPILHACMTVPAHVLISLLIASMAHLQNSQTYLQCNASNVLLRVDTKFLPCM